MFDIFIFYIKIFFYQCTKYIYIYFKIFGGHPQWNSDITEKIQYTVKEEENRERKERETRG